MKQCILNNNNNNNNNNNSIKVKWVGGDGRERGHAEEFFFLIISFLCLFLRPTKIGL